MFKTRLIYNKVTQNLHLRACSTTINKILLSYKPGDEITVKGWIKALRSQKDNVFIDLSDGSTSGKLQIFIPKTVKPDNLSTGASIVATGPLSLSPKGQVELSANSIEILGDCVISEGYPFAPRKQYTPEYIRQYLHFRPRTNKFGALLRVRHAASLSIYNFFNSEGFIKVDTPILTSNDCEGAGEVFKVVPESEQVLTLMSKDGQNKDESYFNKKSFLTVSGQLHLEAAVHGLSKVYTFGPTFRAENSRSRLHLSEFYMLEAEVAFVEQLQETADFVERLLKYVTKTLINSSTEDMERCRDNDNTIDWLDKKFPSITYTEAQKILSNNKDKFEGHSNFSSSQGLAKEHELFLVNYFGGVPVFVTDWPQEIKPFYMKEIQGGNVAAFDLIGPNVGEIVGGSLREDLYDKLKTKIPKNNANLDWYLELRKFGSVPSAGFGLGFERYLQMILGVGNIKDTIPFPRWPHNCTL